MAASVRIQKVATMLHKTLGEIFLQAIPRMLGKVMVTVTEVSMSPDLGTAKVYLSFIANENKSELLAKVEQHKGELRRLLGIRIGNKVRKVPELQFYIDNAAQHAAKMNQLLDTLAILEEEDMMS
jgi:ribosome-binding factor A